jgi:NADPH2:quinone reductase
MRSWQFDSFGSLERLRLCDVPVPNPGPGEVLLRIHFASLNPADQYLVRGLYPGAGNPPFSVGRDGSGVVEAVGPGVGTRFKVGDAAILLVGDQGITRAGTLADYVAVPERSLAPLPEGWTFEEGAAGPLAHLTAWRALVDRAAVQPGERVLVTGASGGVGSAAVVLAKALGGQVVALSRSAEKRARLTELGADAVVDSAGDNLAALVKTAFGGQGADVVIENLGGEYLARCLRMAAPRARIQCIGLLSEFTSVIQLGLLIHKRIRIEGTHVGDYRDAGAAEAWDAVVRTLDAAGRRPLVDTVFAADAVDQAFMRLADGTMGKVLVRFGP